MQLLALPEARSALELLTHWEPVDKQNTQRMALNARLMDPAAIAHIRVRHFDGAESFRYLD